MSAGLDWHRILAASVPSTVMFCCDRDLRYTMVDGVAIMREMGFTRENVIGKHVRDIAQAPDEIERCMRAALAGETITQRMMRSGRHYQAIFAPARIGDTADGEIVGAILIARDIDDVVRDEQRTAALQQAALRELSLRDELTGLFNRRGFHELAEQLIKQAKRSKRGCLLFFCDCNNLKTANDLHGHEAGDMMIRAAGGILKTTFREGDLLARCGGDEFAALMPDVAPEVAGAIRERLWRNCDAYNRAAQHPWRLSLSVGATPFDPHKPVALSRLLELADAAMYASKRRRRETGRSDFSMLAIPQPKRAAE